MSNEPGAPPAAVPDLATEAVPLRRNWRFQLLWIGSTVGFLGMEAATIAYPLVILSLTGSPALAGVFGFAQLLTILLLGVPAGAMVDRYNPRTILLLAEGGRALAAATVAVAVWVGGLTVVHLLVVAIALGAGSACGGPARMIVVRAVVPTQQLTAALTQEEVRNNVGMLAGPPLGGALFGLRQALPFLFCAGTLVISWCCVLAVRTPQPQRPTDGSDGENTGEGLVTELLAGIRVLWRNPMLRAASSAVAVLNTAGAPLVIITVVILTNQGTPEWMIGVAMSGLALGGLTGAALVKPLHRQLRPGVVLLVVLAMQVPVFVALAVPLGPWWVMGVLFFAMLGVPALSVLLDVLIFRQVQAQQRGRVIGAASTLFGAGAPLGAVTAGLLLEHLSAAGAMLAVAAFLALASTYVGSRQELRRAEWSAD